MADDRVVVLEPTEGGKPLDYERRATSVGTVYAGRIAPIAGDTLKRGQKTDVGTSGAALAASATAVRGVLVQASYDNTARCYVGTAGGQTHELEPGDSLGIPIDDVAKVYVRAASGTQKIGWIAVDVG